MRKAEVKRTTKETDIELVLDLDGRGVGVIDTGIGFFDHMLTGFTKHGFFDMTLKCKGDLNVDGHSIRTTFEPAKDDPALEDGRITDEGCAAEIVQDLKGKTIPDVRVSRRPVTEQPPLPFNLVKAILIDILTLILYKRISPLLK